MLCFCHCIFAAAKIIILIAQLALLDIQNLTLVYFKNHSAFSLSDPADVVAISGLNGAGKTTVLDAIHFLCLGKSYFSATDVQCIKYDEQQTGIRATLVHGENYELKVKLQRGKRKIIEKNGVPYKKLAEHIGQFLAVVIAPGDIALIHGANETRRSFINQVLSQVDSRHLQCLLKYNKLIEHRNKHLKQERVDHALLQVLDEQIAPLAAEIYEARIAFLAEFIPVFEQKYTQIAADREKVRLDYMSQLATHAYAELVEMNRAKDLAVQRSFSGVHKDELELMIGEHSLKKYGSQGQIKSTLIALKLAEYEYLSTKTGKKPFLLLDDIFEKIDEQRAEVLTVLLKNDNFGQIFITDTNQDRLTWFCEKIGKPFTKVEL